MAASADRYCNSATTWRPILARRLRDEGCEAARVPRAAEVENVDEPKVLGPLDVVVRIGAAGLCRTDLHVQEGQWAEKSQVELPYTPGHENAGWVHELGSAVTNVEVGDTVIVHPSISCGLRGACRAGDDMHCLHGSFPGINRDGGFADFLLTSAGRWWLACGSAANSSATSSPTTSTSVA
jgi:D-arabinose 1-dehydrogenase-like Zn-dependent alcohol dehydrogenase